MDKPIDLRELSVDQLKKIKESLEKNQKSKLSISNKITKKKSTLLDDFTSIDELLIENITLQRVLIDEQEETNRQMQINNKLLLALYYQEDADGNMIQKDPTGVDMSVILKDIGKVGGHTTIVKSLSGVKGDVIVFDLSDSGFIIEIMFKSSTSTTDNKDYSIRVMADDKMVYQNSFDNFETRSYFERDMTCYENTRRNYYFLQFQNIEYKNKLLVQIYSSNATFEQVYLKYLEV